MYYTQSFRNFTLGILFTQFTMFGKFHRMYCLINLYQIYKFINNIQIILYSYKK